jgi:DNA-directed RNA polymerase specialized sigma subunit
MPSVPRCARGTDDLLDRLAVLPSGHRQRRRLREQIIELNLPYARRIAAQFSRSGEAEAEVTHQLRHTATPAIRHAEAQVTVRALLPEREQRILTMRYYRDMTQATIARRVGVSQMHVSRLINQSLAHLHDLMLAD